MRLCSIVISLEMMRVLSRGWCGEDDEQGIQSGALAGQRWPTSKNDDQ